LRLIKNIFKIISRISAATYYSDVKYKNSLTETIVRSIGSIDVSANNIISLTVTDTVPVSSVRRKLTTSYYSSINASYSIIIWSQFPSGYYEQKLISAVNTGLFTVILQNVSIFYNATALYNSTSSFVQICTVYK
jgi:hypothetical protein